MAKSKHQKPAPPKEKPVRPVPAGWMPWAAAAAAFLLFSTGFGNQMVGMDDNTATLNNPAVRDLDFSSGFNLGMYAPVTWLGYAFAYHLGGKSVLWFHLLSALVHAVNTAVVYRLFYRLSEKKALFSFVLALFFAVHPLQVEAVSWIAGFSTPMFSLFYLLALDYYVRYTGEEGKRAQLLLALGLFLLACLAKSAAVTLPLTLLVVDGWMKRPITRQTLLEKVPFFAISLVFGLLTLYSRGASGHTVSPVSANFDLADRFLMACHTVLFYWTKIIVPQNLSIWYPFEKTATGGWPWPYYAAPVALGAVLFAAWRWRKPLPVLWYGLLFYLSCIILALPYYTIGTFELRSDRYNYLGIIGILAILVSLPFYFRKKYPAFENLSWIALGIAGIWWTSGSVHRIRDWKDTFTIMNSALEATGDNFGQAYLWRGMEYGDRGDGNKALADFNRAIARNPNLVEAYRYRGLLLGIAKQYEKSIEDLNKYLEHHPREWEIYYNRAISHLKLNHTEAALEDLDRTIAINPKFSRAYRTRASVYQQTGQAEKAQADQQQADALDNAPGNKEE